LLLTISEGSFGGRGVIKEVVGEGFVERGVAGEE